MKRIISIGICFLMIGVIAGAQDKDQKENKYTLTSEMMEKKGKQLDEQILELSKKLADIVKKYDLLKAKNIRIVPYQTAYNIGADFIELEKHFFIKDDIYKNKINGISLKRIKIYTNGQTVTKIESEITERNYYSGEKDFVLIIDPSPTTSGTDDIEFSRQIRGKSFLDMKKLGNIKNTTAFPIRNELKREFLIPHLSFFVDSLRFVAEAYYKSMKDSETGLAEFLRKSTQY